ncbi:hypothetical protein EON64_16665 [archaeon]|nr:MAG: hypothetical protein EON64_16665 [archaeon]
MHAALGTYPTTYAATALSTSVPSVPVSLVQTLVPFTRDLVKKMSKCAGFPIQTAAFGVSDHIHNSTAAVHSSPIRHVTRDRSGQLRPDFSALTHASRSNIKLFMQTDKTIEVTKTEPVLSTTTSRIMSEVVVPTILIHSQSRSTVSVKFSMTLTLTELKIVSN